MKKRFHFPTDKLLRYFSDKLQLNETTIVLLLASIVGLIGGFGAVGFRELINLIQTLTIGSHSNILVTVTALPWYKKLLLPVVGGIIVGPLIYYFGKETKGHGVPEVMEAVALKGGKIRTRVMFLKAFVSAVTIGVGGSVGREGPIVQIGSSLGSTLGSFLRVSNERKKLLVACGAAAGIAATFNAPLAGVIFSVEIILGNYAILTLLPLILSSVLATIVGRWYFGNIPAFEIPHYSLNSPLEIGPYILLGILAGLVALTFTKVLYSLEDLAEKVPVKGWFKTPLIMSLVGVMILFFPHVFGVGYDTITPVLRGEYMWYLLLALVPIKMLATSITLAAGGSGGIFAPSLFLGAVFGGFFGSMMNMLFPSVVLSSGAYAVVGMSAMVAGTTHAPITAFLVIFEMTGDYKLILPIMMCSIIASFVSSTISRESIYTLKLLRRGVDLSKGMEVSIMQTTRVSDVMRRKLVVFPEDADFNELLETVMKSKDAYYYVVGENREYLGSFNVHDIKESLNEHSLEGLVVAKDLVSLTMSPSIYASANLAECMKIFTLYDVEELPVIDNKNSMNLIGKVSRRDIITIYDHEILRQGTDTLKVIQSKVTDTLPQQNYVDLPEGFEIVVLPVNRKMSGKTLQELDIRNRFGVTVLAINNEVHGKHKVIIPEPCSELQKGYTLIVLGRIEDLDKFKKSYQLT